MRPAVKRTLLPQTGHGRRPYGTLLWAKHSQDDPTLGQTDGQGAWIAAAYIIDTNKATFSFKKRGRLERC
jgi:hypothetical protein